MFGCVSEARPEPPSGGGAWGPAPREWPSLPPRVTVHSAPADLAGVAGLGLTGCPPRRASASERKGRGRPPIHGAGGLRSAAPRENRRSFCAGATFRPGGAGPGRVGAESPLGPPPLAPLAAECWAPGLF